MKRAFCFLDFQKKHIMPFTPFMPFSQFFSSAFDLMSTEQREADQNPNLVPISIFRGFITFVGCPKNGDVTTPL